MSLPSATNQSNVIDNAPVNRFHRKLTVYCSGGPFLDGYALGVIGFALPQVTTEWDLNGLWQGLLAAAPLFGFPLVVLFGYLTDRVGRRAMYVINIAAIGLLSAAQFFVTGPEQLLVLRILLGAAIGADYPVASSLLAEFAPRRSRARLIGLQTIMWSAGNALAYLLGAAMLPIGADAWRWILLSPAVLAFALALSRLGTPESPRWLMSKGRNAEALVIVREIFGPAAQLDGLAEEPAPTRLRLVFQGQYLRRTIFVVVFWSCSLTPVYAIYSFAPQLLDALSFSEANTTAQSVAIGVLFLIGTVLATLVADRWTRRRLLVGPFAIASVSLLTLGLVPQSSGLVVTLLLAVYAVAIGGPTILQFIYPNELFPTEIRATAFSVGVAGSRIGSVGGTFGVPFLLDNAGIGPTMLVVGVISAVGAAVSFLLAPETRSQTLNDAAAASKIDVS